MILQHRGGKLQRIAVLLVHLALQIALHQIDFLMVAQLPGLVHIFVGFRLHDLGGSGQLLLLNGGTAEPLNLADSVKLPAADKGEGAPRLAGTACTADAVHVVFIVLGKVVIDDHLHIVHIDAPGRHIRSDEDIRAAVPEVVHGHVPLMLGHVTVQTLHTEISLFQHLSQLVHLYLRIAENQAELRLIVFQQADAGGILVLALHPVISLGHQRDGQLLGRYPHQPGILLELIGDVQDGLGHGGGEQRRLMGVGNLAQYQLHVLPEAHVQHLVRFVQHYHVHIVQLDRAAAHMIHHAPRGSHDDLYVPQPLDLLADLLAAVHGKNFDAMHKFRNVPDFLRRLHGQLSGRAQDDGLQLPEVRVYLLQGGYGKGRRLAGSRLGLSDDVLAVQQVGNGLHLNRRQLLKSHLPDRAHDALIQKGLDGSQAGRIHHLLGIFLFFLYFVVFCIIFRFTGSLVRFHSPILSIVSVLLVFSVLPFLGLVPVLVSLIGCHVRPGILTGCFHGLRLSGLLCGIPLRCPKAPLMGSNFLFRSRQIHFSGFRALLRSCLSGLQRRLHLLGPLPAEHLIHFVHPTIT